jgi:hypothetical protein
MMIRTIETTVNGTQATYFVSDDNDKATRKQLRKLADEFRYKMFWSFDSRIDPDSRDDFRSSHPATVTALEAADVDIDASSIIYEGHNG